VPPLGALAAQVVALRLEQHRIRDGPRPHALPLVDVAVVLIVRAIVVAAAVADVVLPVLEPLGREEVPLLVLGRLLALPVEPLDEPLLGLGPALLGLWLLGLPGGLEVDLVLSSFSRCRRRVIGALFLLILHVLVVFRFSLIVVIVVFVFRGRGVVVLLAFSIVGGDGGAIFFYHVLCPAPLAAAGSVPNEIKLLVADILVGSLLLHL
jgi:hypothetical protein